MKKKKPLVKTDETPLSPKISPEKQTPAKLSGIVGLDLFLETKYWHRFEKCKEVFIHRINLRRIASAKGRLGAVRKTFSIKVFLPKVSQRKMSKRRPLLLLIFQNISGLTF